MFVFKLNHASKRALVIFFIIWWAIYCHLFHSCCALRLYQTGANFVSRSKTRSNMLTLVNAVYSILCHRLLQFSCRHFDMYFSITSKLPGVVILGHIQLDRAEHFIEQLTTEPGTLGIVDNIQATHAHLVNTLFKRKFHHYDTYIIHLQNIFDKEPSHRTISLNATYIILFKNMRKISQVSHLDKQVYPGGNGLLRATYPDTTNLRAHSYMVIDFNQAMPKKFCLCNTLSPNKDFLDVFAYGHASHSWTGRWTSAAGEGEH